MKLLGVTVLDDLSIRGLFLVMDPTGRSDFQVKLKVLSGYIQHFNASAPFGDSLTHRAVCQSSSVNQLWIKIRHSSYKVSVSVFRQNASEFLLGF